MCRMPNCTITLDLECTITFWSWMNWKGQIQGRSDFECLFHFKGAELGHMPLLKGHLKIIYGCPNPPPPLTLADPERSVTVTKLLKAYFLKMSWLRPYVSIKHEKEIMLAYMRRQRYHRTGPWLSHLGVKVRSRRFISLKGLRSFFVAVGSNRYYYYRKYSVGTQFITVVLYHDTLNWPKDWNNAK